MTDRVVLERAKQEYISAIVLLHEKDRYLTTAGATVTQDDIDHWTTMAEHRWATKVDPGPPRDGVTPDGEERRDG